MSVDLDPSIELERTLGSQLVALRADHGRIAVAVSGGSDSMALTLLAAEARPGRIVALTVDHGLRDGSHDEARQVGDWLRQCGIEHHVLPWAGAKPASGRQAAARAARYRLMATWCRANHIMVLMTGHTADDQRETLVMRLSRGSGIAGLAGVRMRRRLDGGDPPVWLLRPLQGAGRSTLQQWLRARDQPWIDDPSNANRYFERVRVREALAAFDPALMPAIPVARSMHHLAQLNDELEAAAIHWLGPAIQADAYGCVRIALCPPPALPELLRRGLARVIAAVGGSRPSPEAVSVLLASPSPRYALAGVIVDRTRAEQLLVYREAGHIAAKAVAPCVNQLWDHRFCISCSEAGDIMAIGEADWPQAVALWPDLRLLPCPHPARLALPALRQGGVLRAVGGWHGSGPLQSTPFDLKAVACGIMSAEGPLFCHGGNLSSMDGA